MRNGGPGGEKEMGEKEEGGIVWAKIIQTKREKRGLLKGPVE